VKRLILPYIYVMQTTEDLRFELLNTKHILCECEKCSKEIDMFDNFVCLNCTLDINLNACEEKVSEKQKADIKADFDRKFVSVMQLFEGANMIVPIAAKQLDDFIKTYYDNRIVTHYLNFYVLRALIPMINCLVLMNSFDETTIKSSDYI
jgi:hypothetical protein